MGTVVDRTGPFSGQLWNAGCVREVQTYAGHRGAVRTARTQLIYDGVEHQRRRTPPTRPTGTGRARSTWPCSCSIAPHRALARLRHDGADLMRGDERVSAAGRGGRWAPPPTRTRRSHRATGRRPARGGGGDDHEHARLVGRRPAVAVDARRATRLACGMRDAPAGELECSSDARTNGHHGDQGQHCGHHGRRLSTTPTASGGPPAQEGV